MRNETRQDSTKPAEADAASPAPRFGGLLLAIMCSAQLVLAIDFNVVNIANASIERALHFNSGNLQWTITAYALTFGGFLLLGGRMADLFGRRRLFIWGVIGFAATSFGAGCSQNSTELTASRAAQGLCAALISPTVLSLLAASFPEGRPRQRAYGMWAITGSVGGLVGLLFGGVLTSLLGWRWIFFVNVPVAALAVTGAVIVIPKTLPEAGPRRRLDLPGALTVTLGLGLVIYGFGEAQSTSWTSTATLAALAAAPLFLVAFYLIERRTKEPLLPLGLLRRRAAVANVLAVFQQSAGATTVFLAPLFMQQIWGFSALHAGVSTIPMPIGFGIGARVSSRVVGRLGPRRIILTGFCFIAVGTAWLTQLPAHQSYFTTLAIPIFIRSVGQGLVIVPIALSATAGIRREEQGIAAGLFNMSQQLGGAIGLAAIATVAAAATRAAGGGIAGGTHGIHVAFLVTLCLPLMAAGITVLALRNPIPGSAGVEGVREVFPSSTTDPLPVVARSDGVGDASFVPPDPNRALKGPLSLEPYGGTGGVDLSASRSRDCPDS
jgi:EmrB/QacA subfamily drug resistance transporter